MDTKIKELLDNLDLLIEHDDRCDSLWGKQGNTTRPWNGWDCDCIKKKHSELIQELRELLENEQP